MDNVSIREHEGSMIGVQYQSVIKREHVKVLKGSFQKVFAIECSMLKLVKLEMQCQNLSSLDL